jgi:zinc/manganese transport system substrate-binding protein
MRQNGRQSRYATLGRRRLLGTACLPLLTMGGRAARALSRPEVVATFSVLRDLAATIAGGEADVAALVGNDGDTHSYQSRPVDVQRLSRASLLVSNGLGFEQWLPRILGAGHFAGRQVVASEGVVPLVHATSPGAADRMLDPHCWHDVANARRYVANITAGLEAVDAANTPAYRDRAGAVDARLAALDAWVRAEIARVPPDKRRVITGHDAFGYFAHAYGVEFLAVRGMNAEQEPSARDVAALITLVRKQKTRALFFENLGSPVLIEQIARDSGGVVGPALYPDALSPPSGPAATYEAMMRHNVSALVAGMLQN